ncbi:hypothetical protein [Azospirillum brasilense]|uniref:hypothetical protein n=1 Tax=Azospirillum brasilense TaxID=192 RepID=UPI0016452DF8|nr:hypothetical protein [Azospirillum brasilense]
MNTQNNQPITSDIVDDIEILSVADNPTGHEVQQSSDDIYHVAAGLAHRPSA